MYISCMCLACTEQSEGTAPWIIAIGIIIPLLVLGVLLLLLLKLLLLLVVNNVLLAWCRNWGGGGGGGGGCPTGSPVATAPQTTPVACGKVLLGVGMGVGGGGMSNCDSCCYCSSNYSCCLW